MVGSRDLATLGTDWRKPDLASGGLSITSADSKNLELRQVIVPIRLSSRQSLRHSGLRRNPENVGYSDTTGPRPTRGWRWEDAGWW